MTLARQLRHKDRARRLAKAALARRNLELRGGLPEPPAAPRTGFDGLLDIIHRDVLGVHRGDVGVMRASSLRAEAVAYAIERGWVVDTGNLRYVEMRYQLTDAGREIVDARVAAHARATRPVEPDWDPRRLDAEGRPECIGNFGYGQGHEAARLGMPSDYCSNRMHGCPMSDLCWRQTRDEAERGFAGKDTKVAMAEFNERMDYLRSQAELASVDVAERSLWAIRQMQARGEPRPMEQVMQVNVDDGRRAATR